MKQGNGHGKAVWLASSAALLALAAVCVPAEIHAARPRAILFSPPASPLMLTRTLHRPLPDGKEVVTRRTYAVRIQRDGKGFRVDGTLVDVQVDAPPSLAALADIERRRPDIGLFPIMLDAQGMITGGDMVQSDGSLDRAAVVASRQIEHSRLAVRDKLQAQTFVRQLRPGSANSAWPADVFHPVPGTRSEDKAIPLPGGEVGRVTVEIVARTGGAGGQIAALDRIVTTDLGSDTRVTREAWQLSRTGAENSR